MRHIILLSGYKMSGKDTVGKYLVEQHGFVRLAMADALKDYVAEKYGIIRKDLDDPGKKEQPLSPYPVHTTDTFTGAIHRLLAAEFHTAHLGQGVGQAYWTPRALCILEGSIGRAVDPQFWTAEVAKEIGFLSGANFVVTDVRYHSEVEFLKGRFPESRIVRVSRGGPPDTLDPSERDLDNYIPDHVLENTGTIEELHEQVKALLGSPTECIPVPTRGRTIDVRLADGSYITVGDL